MIVALATLVSRNAVNVSTMSPATNTPPSAVARIVAHERRWPVTAKIAA